MSGRPSLSTRAAQRQVEQDQVEQRQAKNMYIKDRIQQSRNTSPIAGI